MLATLVQQQTPTLPHAWDTAYGALMGAFSLPHPTAKRDVFQSFIGMHVCWYVIPWLRCEAYAKHIYYFNYIQLFAFSCLPCIKRTTAIISPLQESHINTSAKLYLSACTPAEQHCVPAGAASSLASCECIECTPLCRRCCLCVCSVHARVLAANCWLSPPSAQ